MLESKKALEDLMSVSSGLKSSIKEKHPETYAELHVKVSYCLKKTIELANLSCALSK